MSRMRDRWDIVATANAGPEALWYGSQLALRLGSHHGAHVCLFTDQLDELGKAVEGIDRRALEQSWNGICVLDQRLARLREPAAKLLVVFDSILPGAYIQSLVSRPSRGIALKLLRLDDASRAEPLRLRGREVRLYGMRQGDIDHARGLVKAATTDSLPASSHLAANTNARTVLAVADADGTWRKWLGALCASRVPIRLLVAGAAGEEVRALLPTLEDSASVQHGPLTVRLVPTSTWQEMDHLLAAADLVLTTREDVLIRSAVQGVPVVYKGWRSSPGLNTQSWLVHRLRFHVHHLAQAWRSGEPDPLVWNGFCGAWPEAVASAKETACRLSATPHLADSISAFAQESERGMRDDRRGRARQTVDWAQQWASRAQRPVR